MLKLMNFLQMVMGLTAFCEGDCLAHIDLGMISQDPASLCSLLPRSLDVSTEVRSSDGDFRGVLG